MLKNEFQEDSLVPGRDRKAINTEKIKENR